MSETLTAKGEAFSMAAMAEYRQGGVGDYFALLKPRVMSLVVFTSIVGMVAAPGDIHWFLGFIAILCIAVGAGASGALNMWYEADLDAKMERTKERPIPAGAVSPGDALGFASALAIASVVTMGLLINIASALWLAGTIGFYVVIYTMWLKRRTPQNIVIGGASGALPPVIGWAAVTGSVSIEPIRCSRSSSCGRRRTSGRWRWSAMMITKMRVCPCCPWWRVSRIPNGRSCYTACYWCLWLLRLG